MQGKKWMLLVVTQLRINFGYTDPDGNEWEFFYTKADVETMTQQSTCCATPPTEVEIKNSSCC